MKTVLLVLSAALLACASAVEGVPPVACVQLETLRLPDVRILSAEEVAAGERAPAHCKVAGVIGTEIGFELLLPVDWNGRFVMGGGGGFSGRIQNHTRGSLPGGSALERGYATVGTDTGHRSDSGIRADWALDHLERKLNFGYLAVHRTAEVAKALVRAHYDAGIDYAYFLGCSRGGGQAMMEAQRYPDDFDGIVAGAPAYHWNGIGAGFLQTQQAIYPDPADVDTPVLTPDNLALLEARVLEACDALDGVADGVLDDPRACPFSPADLPRCPSEAPAPDCVTGAQFDAIRAIYDGPRNGEDALYPGFPFGGEHDEGGWGTWIVGGEDRFGDDVPSLHYAFGTEMYKYLVFDDPEWDYASYDFSTWEEDTRAAASYLNADDPDLSAFRDRGGKLILWQGWSDPAITALGTIAYYEAVDRLDPDAHDYARLFMMPGVLHCGGGPGPDRVDFWEAIEAWVERGKAPDRLIAEKRDADGNVVRTRPLCPYPQRAVYDGTGSPDEAASFTCREP